MKKISQSIAILVFGVIVPLALLSQAYLGLSSLSSQVSGVLQKQNSSQIFRDARVLLHDANDYALFSLISAERTNHAVVTNKQIMKVAVMQIGFAVISIAVMFIILGINDGGAEGGFEASGLKFDLKTGSTGAVVFVIGAAMAAAGGIIKNDYQTVPIPGFIDRGDGEASRAHAETVALYKECKKMGGAVSQECFYKLFSHICGRCKLKWVLSNFLFIGLFLMPTLGIAQTPVVWKKWPVVNPTQARVGKTPGCFWSDVEKKKFAC